VNTLLVGMGNPILCDDAVGIRLAKDFKKQLTHRFRLDVIEECSVGGLNLLDLLAEYARVIVLDSIHTSGGKPGEWYFFTADSLRETYHLTNIHDANFTTALKLGHAMGMPLPDPSNILIFAVEIEDNRTFSEQMSAELERGYTKYASEILEEIKTLLSNGTSEITARNQQLQGAPGL